MESACVYEQKTVIHELSEGIQMAKQLRFNLNSAEAREFLIHKILSSYENALFVLKSGDSPGQPQATALPAHSLPESPISARSPQSEEFGFDQPFIYQQGQNAVPKKRKGSTTWEDEVRMCTDDGFEIPYNAKHTCNHGAQWTTDEANPTDHHQLSQQNSNEMFSNLSSNVGVNTSEYGIPSSFSFPATPFGFMEDYQQINSFPNHFDDELLQVYSSPFISPESSESNYISDWGSSPSLDFAADHRVDVDPYFEYNNSFLLDGNYYRDC